MPFIVHNVQYDLYWKPHYLPYGKIHWVSLKKAKTFRTKGAALLSAGHWVKNPEPYKKK